MSDKRSTLMPEDDRIITGHASVKREQHTVAAGESLSKIAAHYYGDAEKWQVIYEANKAVIGNDPNVIKVGQVLVIPKA